MIAATLATEKSVIVSGCRGGHIGQSIASREFHIYILLHGGVFQVDSFVRHLEGLSGDPRQNVYNRSYAASRLTCWGSAKLLSLVEPLISYSCR